LVTVVPFSCSVMVAVGPTTPVSVPSTVVRAEAGFVTMKAPPIPRQNRSAPSRRVRITLGHTRPDADRIAKLRRNIRPAP